MLGDVHDLPFGDQTFDLVYGRYILEHVSDPIQVIQQAKRVLVPDGRICFQENSTLWMEFYSSVLILPMPGRNLLNCRAS